MLLSWIPAPDFHIILNRLSVIMLLFNNSMEQHAVFTEELARNVQNFASHVKERAGTPAGIPSATTLP